MGARGPKVGFKQAREAAAAAALAAGLPAPVYAPSKKKSKKAKPAPKPVRKTAADREFESWVIAAPVKAAPSDEPIVVSAPAPRSASEWDNPAFLSGESLRTFGHKQGLSLSAMAAMPDAKIRTELAYLAYRRSEI